MEWAKIEKKFMQEEPRLHYIDNGIKLYLKLVGGLVADISTELYNAISYEIFIDDKMTKQQILTDMIKS